MQSCEVIFLNISIFVAIIFNIPDLETNGKVRNIYYFVIFISRATG